MRPLRWLLALALAVGLAGPAAAENKKLLLVTDSGGFIHDSVGLAEQILKEIGPKHGFDVTCYRFTRDPNQKVKKKDGGDTASAKYAEQFRKTTGVPVEPRELRPGERRHAQELRLRAVLHDRQPAQHRRGQGPGRVGEGGAAIAGIHCGTDTLYPAKDRPMNAAYGDLIGAYFDGHPWHQKIRVVSRGPAAPGRRTGSRPATRSPTRSTSSARSRTAGTSCTSS